MTLDEHLHQIFHIGHGRQDKIFASHACTISIDSDVLHSDLHPAPSLTHAILTVTNIKDERSCGEGGSNAKW